MNKISLDAMSLDEKLSMMELIWDDLCTRAGDVASPSWHGKVLADREAALARGEETIEDWDTVKQLVVAELVMEEDRDVLKKLAE